MCSGGCPQRPAAWPLLPAGAPPPPPPAPLPPAARSCPRGGVPQALSLPSPLTPAAGLGPVGAGDHPGKKGQGRTFPISPHPLGELQASDPPRPAPRRPRGSAPGRPLALPRKGACWVGPRGRQRLRVNLKASRRVPKPT